MKKIIYLIQDAFDNTYYTEFDKERSFWCDYIGQAKQFTSKEEAEKLVETLDGFYTIKEVYKVVYE